MTARSSIDTTVKFVLDSVAIQQLRGRESGCSSGLAGWLPIQPVW
jgi:hypothetical protein